MAYIYKITNDINNKVYIGKTSRASIQERFNEHCSDCQKRNEENRPLYSAMKKYGVEHFRVELIEETDNPIEREIFWINKYDSFKNGYNATIGGDGKPFLDYKKILELYDNTNLSSLEISYECKCHPDSVRKIVKEYRDDVNWGTRFNRHKLNNNISVMCVETGQIFDSCYCASKWLLSIKATNSISYAKNRISLVVQEKIKQTKVCGYTWIKC